MGGLFAVSNHVALPREHPLCDHFRQIARSAWGDVLSQKSKLMTSCALAALVALLAAEPVGAQGSVTPSFGDGKLVLVGEGYRAGERIEITVRAGGASHRFTATADAQGRFRLDTGLAVPPLTSVEMEARDEQGLTQVTITTAPGAPPGPGPGAPTPAGRTPTQLPRTGQPQGGTLPFLALVGAIGLLCVGTGLAARSRRRSEK